MNHDFIFHPKESDGWNYSGYPPFNKKIVVFFIESVSFHIGHIVMSGTNRVCLMEDNTNRLYDLDRYMSVWKVVL